MLINLSLGTGSTLYAINNGDPVLSVVAFCKLRIYLLQSSSMMYRWCLTMASFDRYALSSTSQRVRDFATVGTACHVIVAIIIAWIILPVHTLILYNISGANCGIFQSVTMALYHSLFTTISGSVLPVTLMTICSLLIYRNLVLKQRRRQQTNTGPSLDGSDRAAVSQRRRDQQVLLMLLVQISVYVCLIAPLMGVYFYNAASLYVRNKSAERVAIERFALFVAEAIIYLFPASSFYLYTIASRVFRRELLRMLSTIVRCKWNGDRRRIEPSNKSTDR